MQVQVATVEGGVISSHIGMSARAPGADTSTANANETATTKT